MASAGDEARRVSRSTALRNRARRRRACRERNGEERKRHGRESECDRWSPRAAEELRQPMKGAHRKLFGWAHGCGTLCEAFVWWKHPLSEERRAMTNLRFSLVWMLGALAACNAPRPRDEPTPSPPREKNGEVQAVVPSSASAPAASPEPTDGPLEVTEDGWVDTFSYRMKAIRFLRCPKSARAGTSADAEPSSLLLGVLVQVRAKYDELLVAPRDFTLEKGGVIVSTEIEPEPCGIAALLQPRQLKSGQVTTGLVVFRVPEAAFVPAATFAYRATRWGGAPRAALSVPACWPCPSEAVAERTTR